MEIPLGSAIFLDTNILIYLKNENSNFHNKTKNIIESLQDRETVFFISNQILREYYGILTMDDQPIQEVLEDIKEFQIIFEVLFETNDSTECLVQLCDEYGVKGKQIHDANIVSIMKSNLIQYLFTNNTEDFIRYKDFLNIIDLS